MSWKYAQKLAFEDSHLSVDSFIVSQTKKEKVTHTAHTTSLKLSHKTCLMLPVYVPAEATLH